MPDQTPAWSLSQSHNEVKRFDLLVQDYTVQMTFMPFNPKTVLLYIGSSK